MTKAYLPGSLVLAIDFDGTITTNPDMGHYLELQPEVKRVLTRLHGDDVILCLWTCRSGPALQEALDFLTKENMLHLFTTINEQLPEIEAKYAPHTARKLGADFYIDDKNIMFTVDWVEIEQFIYGED